MFKKTLDISSSPHIYRRRGTDDIMRNVVWAMMPIVLFSVYSFGLNALLVIAAATIASVVTEHLLCKLSKTETTVSDYSAVITGILLGLTLPPTFPLWMAFVGGIIAIALGKYIFGGLGYNVFNPALVARAVLQAAFPVAITTWHPAFLADRFTNIAESVFTWPFMTPHYDAISGATPLSAFKFDGITTSTTELAFGQISGSAGETCAIIIALGGIYLIARKMMSWRIPVAVLSSAFLLSGILYLINSEIYPSPVFMLLSGGLMLGAVFMATDMVSSPLTPTGLWIYGSIIGILTIVIRVWSGLAEGVMYSILLANAISPHIDNLVRSRVYGTKKKNKSYMSKTETIEKQNTSGSAKMLRAMLVIGIISALLIVSAFELTLPRVERLKAEALEKAIFKVLPGTVSTQAFGLNDKGELIALEDGDKPESTYYKGYDTNEKLVGYAVDAAGQGYADIIRVLYGYDPKEQILIGFQVLESKETPGLGDKIEKDQQFLNNFKALDVSLNNDRKLKNTVITVKQGEKKNDWEIDGITGATISSRAIGNIMGTSTKVVVPILYNDYMKKVDTHPNQKQEERNE